MKSSLRAAATLALLAAPAFAQTPAPAADLAAGKARVDAVCAACHGADGKGNAALGAPNLTDKVWLHGWGEDAIVAMVNGGKTSVMPAHASRLTPEPRSPSPTSRWPPSTCWTPSRRPTDSTWSRPWSRCSRLLARS